MAQVLLRVYGDLTSYEVFAHPLRHMPAEGTSEAAVEKARAWALESIPKDYGIDPSLLDVNLMKAPIFT